MDNDTTDAASAQQNLEESRQWWWWMDKDTPWQKKLMEADKNLTEYENNLSSNGWMNMIKEKK